MCPTEDAAQVEDLAARFVLAREDGHDLDLDELAGELPDEDSRAVLRQLVADAGALRGLMPVLVRPGVVLGGRYKVLREVGSGGMGKVFEAEDAESGRRVAVKVLAGFGGRAVDPVKQYRREATVLAALRHPNVVAIHALEQDGDVSYMVMDLVSGRALHQVLERAGEALDGQHPREPDTLVAAVALTGSPGVCAAPQERTWFGAVAQVCLVIARTLESAHAHGLVHRMIMPRNILLRPDRTPVLLDFGLAGIAGGGGGDMTRGRLASAAYLAPEQAVTGRAGSDPRTDIYQLGAVMYEMLTLHRAFPGDSITDLLRRISMGDFVAPRNHDKGLPVELEAICLAAMETHPNDRYKSAAEFAVDLSCYLDGSALPRAARGGPWKGLGRRVLWSVSRCWRQRP